MIIWIILYKFLIIEYIKYRLFLLFCCLLIDVVIWVNFVKVKVVFYGIIYYSVWMEVIYEYS